MNMMTRITAAAGIALLSIGAGTVIAPVGGARAAEERPAIDPQAMAEGRIAFLESALKVTDAQRPLWNNVVAVIRQNAVERANDRAEIRKAQTALAKLQAIRDDQPRRAAELDNFIAAFRPFYYALSIEQRQVADRIFAHPMHGGF